MKYEQKFSFIQRKKYYFIKRDKYYLCSNISSIGRAWENSRDQSLEYIYEIIEKKG